MDGNETDQEDDAIFILDSSVRKCPVFISTETDDVSWRLVYRVGGSRFPTQMMSP